MTKRQAEELLRSMEAHRKVATLSDSQYEQGHSDGFGQALAVLKCVVRAYPDAHDKVQNP